VRVVPGGQVEAELADTSLRAFVEGALRSLSLARTPRFFKDTDGRFPLTVEEPADPGQRRVRVHRDDGEAVVYVLDQAGKLRREERTAGGAEIVTTYEAFMRSSPGRVLPVRFTTTYRDVARDAVERVVTVVDTYVRLEYAWVPATRQATVTEDGPGRALSLQLEDIATFRQ
jgi:hypothetical protein